MNKKRLSVVLATVVFLVLTTGGVLAEGTTVDFGGSFETKVISQAKNEAMPLPMDLPLDPLGVSVRFRGNLSFAPSEEVTVKLRVGYMEDTIQEKLDPTVVNTFTLDRAYLDFTPSEVVSFRFGKQRLAWGTGYAWNLTDILDEPRDAFTAVDDAPGVVAFRSDVTLGPVTGQAVLVPAETWEKSGRALRVKTSPAGVDLTAGVVQKGTEPVAYTADFACSLSGVGLHGEVLYQAEGNRRTDKKDILNYLVGVDYNFPGDVYLALEYYHNDTAFQDMADLQAFQIQYLLSGHTQEELKALLEDLLYKDLLYNGGAFRDHVFLRGRKAVGENWLGEVMLVYTPVDGSLVAQPRVEYRWGENTTVYLQGLLTSGEDTDEASLLPLKSRVDLGVRVSF